MTSATESRPRADLHTHSNASDGADAPAELVELASRRGLSVLALTDHDTTTGLAAAAAAGGRVGLRVIRGLELSTDVPRGELHILGYGIDPDDAALQAALADLRERGARRLHVMLERLREQGIDLPDAVIERRDERESVGRPHIARALVAAGHVGSIQEAFQRYLAHGRPAYVPKSKLAPADAIALVRGAGGLPFMAHPFSLPDFEEQLPELQAAGLAGLEAYYGEYDDERRRRLAELAAERGLLVSGGSDYHGEHFKQGRELGAVDLPGDVLPRFLGALDAR